MNDRIIVPTRGKGLYEITGEVQAVVARSGLDEGLCTGTPPPARGR